MMPAGPHRWAVIDVETSGLYPHSHRVLSFAALALDEQGRVEREVSSLIDAGCDPGPVHIHGLTRQRLVGAPRFADVLPNLHELLEGRVLVAHNAAFDYGFLTAEAARAGTSLPTRQRLCTLALSRRLGLDVDNHRLGTLAGHWGVPQQRAHDAADDARVLAGVFAHSADLAHRLGMTLPVMSCSGKAAAKPYPTRIVKTPCPWRCPGPLRPGAPLVQGMKLVITGDTRLPREELVARLTSSGLEVLSSVSRLTSALICNDPTTSTDKALRAGDEGTTVVDETTVLRLLEDVRAGQPKPAGTSSRTSSAAAPNNVELPTQRPASITRTGPLSGLRVLVLGGTHEQAARVRCEVVARGGSAAVNLNASVTDLVLLEKGHNDPRLKRALAAGVRAHEGPLGLGIELPVLAESDPALHVGVTELPVAQPANHNGQTSTAPVAVLIRGAVLDLPPERLWTLNVAWRSDALATGAEVDVVAILLDASERVVTDEDFVFYNAPISQDGAVALSLDGDSEQSIRVDLELLPEYCVRVIIAAALAGTSTFGDLGALTLSLDGHDATIASATLDAGTTERTMLLAELYRRGENWRVRAVGQGYDDGLAELAVRHGVDVK